MYNEQMEGLISAALADGVLTEKEKQILFKKAQSMGIDLDEFEMVLDARLVELKKKEAREAEQHQLEIEKAKAAQKSAPKSNKFGDVRKCPACGAMVESFQTKCPECGHEFINIEANSTTQELLKALEDLDKQVTSNESTIGSMVRGAASIFGEDSLTTRKTQLIRNFPIPNTKEDLLEMLSLCNANSTASSQNSTDMKIASAWQEKTKQLIMKGRIMLKNDPDFEYTLAEIAKEEKKRFIKAASIKIGLIILIIVLIIFMILMFSMAFSH